MPDDFYSKWSNLIENKSGSEWMNPTCPDIKDYNLPTNQEEWDEMLSKMMECGINKESGVEIIRKRKDDFIKAMNDYKILSNLVSNDGD